MKKNLEKEKISTVAGFEPTRASTLDFESNSLTARTHCHGVRLSEVKFRNGFAKYWRARGWGSKQKGKGECVTKPLAKKAPARIELATSRLLGGRNNRYAMGPMWNLSN